MGSLVPADNSFVYTREKLLQLRDTAGGRHTMWPPIPRELWRKKKRRRGCRAGTLLRIKKRRYRPALPSVVMGNVRSLANKMDELTALTRHHQEFRECSMMLLTETWLTEGTPDPLVSLDGFKLLRADRTRESGKRKGGGLAMFVNNRWCNPRHIVIKEQTCCEDIELLAVSMRPFYLPRELSHVIVIAAYVPPSAKADTACEVLQATLSLLQLKHPQALFLLSGDFNHASPSSTLPSFTQYVTCHTRDNKTLDLFFANVREAYNSSALPPLGRSDHNLVHLRPVYKPLVRREPAVTRTVRIWSEESDEALRDCFDTTAWEVLQDSYGEDIEGLTHCITDYINFCVDNTVPTKVVRCFSNNKPWINSDIKTLLKEKKMAFRTRDKEGLREVQKELRHQIRQGKASYKEKMKKQLERKDIRGVWEGLKSISGHKQSVCQIEADVNWLNELNLFFNRFDHTPAPPTPACPSAPLTTMTSPHSPHVATSQQTSKSRNLSLSDHSLTFTRAQVRKEMKKINARKAAGPDDISARLIKTCGDQLCGIITYMYNMSLRQEIVPELWKSSCVVPVPKKPHPMDLNDYRPVALTSHLMKILERLVLTHLRPLVSPAMDPLQFAYRPGIGVDDAIIHLLHRALSHLEKPGNTVRIMFFDFSSAFNTIQPRLLRDKLGLAGVDHHLSNWILDYLTNRPQYVRAQDCVSGTVICNTGAPQGTVLAPFLFTLYTADFRCNSSSCYLQKYSDDSAIVGLITDDDDREYRELNQDFVDWCHRNHLKINAGKTKEMVVDFRKGRSPPKPVDILGTGIEIVNTYKYLGLLLNNKLDWADHMEALYRKGHSRLYLLRKLRAFGIRGALLRTFFNSVVASAIFFGVACWGSSISTRDRNKLDKLIRKASSVLGSPLDPVQVVGDRRILSVVSSMQKNNSHPMHETVIALSSTVSDRLLHPRCEKERYRKSFLPTAVRLHNQHRPKRRSLHTEN